MDTILKRVLACVEELQSEVSGSLDDDADVHWVKQHEDMMKRADRARTDLVKLLKLK